MKKLVLFKNFGLKTILILGLSFLFSNNSWGQQVIGSFPSMDGGFEGQTLGALGGVVSPTAWSLQTTGTGTIGNTNVRTGLKSVNFYTTSTAKRLQSPSTLVDAISNIQYTVQYYYRTATSSATAASMQIGVSANGTTNPSYFPNGVPYTSLASSNPGWTKYTAQVTVSTAPNGNAGIGIIRCNTPTMGVALDIDDFIMYSGTLDTTSPDAPTLPTFPSVAASQQTISWAAPLAGVDGGGYMVVRSTADPTTVPNTNGIYAIGNFISGTEKVVYLGTTPSFNDTGLSPSTPYFYRIYTVDKAFNYSLALTANNTTTAPSYAAEPTSQPSNITFSNVSQTGLTINWTAGNGTNSIVVIKSGSAVNADPSDGNTYSSNVAFGSGTQLGTGNYVVYSGSNTSISITGLSKFTNYYVKVYTFNGSAGSENYFITSPPTGNQLTLPGEITSNGSGGGNWTTGSTWAGGVVPTQYDNVTIAGSDVVNVSATSSCYNLTIPTGTKVWSIPTGGPPVSGSTLKIYGTSLSSAGTIGDALIANSQLTLEFGGNLTISGSGSIYPFKIRPVTLLSNIGVTFDTNVTITGTGTTLMFDNVSNDNIYYTVNSPRTLNIATNFNTCSSSATQSTSNNTLTINSGATVNVSGVLNTNEITGKTYTANINGTLAVTGTSTLFGTNNGGVATFNVNGTYTATGNLNVTPIGSIVAPVINVGSAGEIIVNGTADFSNTSLVGYIGNTPSTSGGKFTLGATGTIKFANASGLEPVAGPIRTTNRNFTSGSSYSFVGIVPQVSGADLPSSISNLTINNINGVTLESAKTINGALTLTAGNLITNGNKLTIGANGTVARTSGFINCSAPYDTIEFNNTSAITLPASLFNGNVQNMTINGAGGVTLGSATSLSGKLTLTAGTLNTGNYLTLKSTATTTASVAQVPASGAAISGNVTVERYIPAKRAWRALTSPVNTTNSISTNWQEGGVTGNGSNGLDIWSNTAGTGIISGGTGSSLLAYNSSTNTWSGITDTTTSSSLLSGSVNKPFMAFVTGPFGSNHVTSGAEATTIRATGTLFTGDQTYTNVANQYTFIGNPYASPLDPSLMLASNASFSGNIWVWDANATGLNTVGTYNLFNNGTYSNITSNPVVTSGTQIQSGQAFFVKSTDGTAFTITEAHKGTAMSNALFRTGALPELLRVGLYKQVNNEWSGRDGAMTVILSDADANQPSNKMANGTENIAFTKNAASFASNHHLPLVDSDVLNVKVWNTTAGANYKLKINTEEFTATNLDATLEDLFTNARTALVLDGTAVEYPFTVTPDALSTGNRFKIVFQSSALGTNNPKSNGISIVPNPVTGDSFQVNLGTLAIGTYTYSICNSIGQEVEKGSINNAIQNSNYSIKMSNSATGIYIMKIKGNDNSVFTAKIIKK